jgi:hypothetical protein
MHMQVHSGASHAVAVDLRPCCFHCMAVSAAHLCGPFYGLRMWLRIVAGLQLCMNDYSMCWRMCWCVCVLTFYKYRLWWCFMDTPAADLHSHFCDRQLQFKLPGSRRNNTLYPCPAVGRLGLTIPDMPAQQWAVGLIHLIHRSQWDMCVMTCMHLTCTCVVWQGHSWDSSTNNTVSQQLGWPAPSGCWSQPQVGCAIDCPVSAFAVLVVAVLRPCRVCFVACHASSAGLHVG